MTFNATNVWVEEVRYHAERKFEHIQAIMYTKDSVSDYLCYG